MKKILSIMVLGILLFGMSGSSALAVKTCTEVDATFGTWECEDDETCSTTVQGQCNPGTGGAGPPQRLKDYCQLGSNVTIKTGKLGTTIVPGCVTIGGTVAGAGDVCSTPGAPCVFQAKDGNGVPCTVGKANINSWGMVCLLNTVNSVTNWLFYILLIAVVLMGVIGGVIYLSSAGDAEKAGKGKSVIIYAIIGLVLALIARLIPSVVRLIVGM